MNNFEKPKMPKNFKCEICEESFTTKQIIDNHVKRIHEGLKEIKCRICTEVFTSNGS